jgi:hypothetical protein
MPWKSSGWIKDLARWFALDLRLPGQTLFHQP